MNMKRCSQCEQTLPETDFYRQGNKRRANCIDCYKQRSLRYDRTLCRHPGGCGRVARKKYDGWCTLHGTRVADTGSPGPLGPVGKYDEHYGDKDFGGYGVIVCYGCGRPYRDHRLTERCE